MSPETKAWLDLHHPASRDPFEHDVRCPTCDEWAPCRVRDIFRLFNILALANGAIAPKWWDGGVRDQDR